MSKKTQNKSARPGLTARAAAKNGGPGLSAGLAQGDPAPAFSLPDGHGHVISPADFVGRKLVVFFYPRAGTPGCTIEASDFNRLGPEFAAANTAVLGVSADPPKAIESFRKKQLLEIPLVTDEIHDTLKSYGVWEKKSMYGKVFDGIVRTTFLIGEDGRILKVWRKVKVEGHADEVLAVATAGTAFPEN